MSIYSLLMSNCAKNMKQYWQAICKPRIVFGLWFILLLCRFLCENKKEICVSPGERLPPLASCALFGLLQSVIKLTKSQKCKILTCKMRREATHLQNDQLKKILSGDCDNKVDQKRLKQLDLSRNRASLVFFHYDNCFTRMGGIIHSIPLKKWFCSW